MKPSLQGLRIGYIGLGNMGSPGARHLHQAGASVTVWNRSPGPMAKALELGMQTAESPADLASRISDGIFCLNLTNTDAVQSVVFGPNGLMEALSDQSLIIDFGTTSVPSTRQFAKRVPLVDAPVSGGQVGAEAGIRGPRQGDRWPAEDDRRQHPGRRQECGRPRPGRLTPVMAATRPRRRVGSPRVAVAGAAPLRPASSPTLRHE